MRVALIASGQALRGGRCLNDGPAQKGAAEAGSVEKRAKTKGAKTKGALGGGGGTHSHGSTALSSAVSSPFIAGANDVARSGVVGKRHVVRMRGPLHRPRLLTQIVDSPNADTNHSA